MELINPALQGIYGRYDSDLVFESEPFRDCDQTSGQDEATRKTPAGGPVEVRKHCVTVDAHYFEKENICAAVTGLFCSDAGIDAGANQAALLIENYRSAGLPGALDRLGGSFSFFLLDTRTKQLFLSVDRFGIHPIYWSKRSGRLNFGSTADSVRLSEPTRPGVSNQSILNYLFFHMIPSPGTIYEDIFKLPAAHYLEATGQNIQVRRYWRPSFSEDVSQDKKALEKELLDRLAGAVSNCRDQERACAFLSGGLDSSTVSGMLAKASDETVDTYSIGFDAPGYDEIEYARIAARHFGTNAHEYYVTPEDVLDSLPRIMAFYDEPFGNSSAIPAYHCARIAAEDGHTRILAGDGGDEIFSGNARYAQQKVFDYYRLIPEWLKRYVLAPGIGILPEQSALARKARNYIRQAETPLPRRLQEYNFYYRLGAGTIFDEDFLASVDPSIPQSIEDNLYSEPKEATSLNRMLYLDWHHTLADNDLRKVSRTCRMAGIDVSFPLLNDDLVDLSCRIPSAWKMPGNRLRGFYKDAVSDFLPSAIIDKKKHGFGLPFGIWMNEHPKLRELANDSLLSLKNRHFFKSTLIDRAVDLHRNEHSSYYGELIWILVSLEIWLTSHQQS